MYNPINGNVFACAFAGALSGMAAANRVNQSSVTTSFDAMSTVATYWAEEFDAVWNNTAALQETEAFSIQDLSYGFWSERVPLVNNVDSNPQTWTPFVTSLITAIHSSNTALASLVGPLPAWPSGSGGGANVIVASGGDDAPAIQAWFNAHAQEGVALTLQGPIQLQTPITFPNTSLNYITSLTQTIYVDGSITYTNGSGEMCFPPNYHIEGIGGARSPDPLAFDKCAEITCTDAYWASHNRDSSAALTEFVTVFDIGSLNTIPTVVGQVVTCSAATGGVNWTGNTFKCIASYQDIDGTYHIRLVRNTAGTVPSGNPTAMTFTDGTWTGTGGALNGSFQCLHVTGLGRAWPSSYQPHSCTPGSPLNSWAWVRHTNDDLAFTYNLWRVMGRGNNTEAYLCALTCQLDAPTLPDYGFGGTALAPTIYYTEIPPAMAFPGGSGSANNLAFFNAVGAAISATGYYFDFSENVYYAGPECGIPLILDSVTYLDVTKSRFVGASMPMNIYKTVTGMLTGQAGGLDTFRKCIFEGGGIWDQTQQSGYPLGGTWCEDIFQEGSVLVPGQSWGAFYIVDPRTSYYNGIQITSVGIESGYPFYSIEALHGFPPYTNLNIYQGVQNVIIDGWTEVPPGPNIALAATVNGPGASSSLKGNLTYNVNQDRGANFAPAPTQARWKFLWNGSATFLVDLLTWQQLTVSGSLVFSSTDAGGNPLIGPDGSLGKVIRVSSLSTGSTSAIILQDGFSSNIPAVGDTIIIRARVKAAAGSGFPVQQSLNGISFLCSDTGVHFNNAGFQNSTIEGSPGGTWYDYTSVFTVTAATGTPANTFITLSASLGNDFIFDPECLQVQYLPATDGLSQEEIFRMARNIPTMINGTIEGQCAVPKYTKFAFGANGLIEMPDVYTTATAATVVDDVAVYLPQGGVLKVVWQAIVCGGGGAQSFGEFLIPFIYTGGAVTTTGIANEFKSNCGVGGAAAAVPITFTTAAGGEYGHLYMNVNAQSAAGTKWSFAITRVAGAYTEYP